MGKNWWSKQEQHDPKTSCFSLLLGCTLRGCFGWSLGRLKLPISFTNASPFFCLWGWLPASVLLPLFFPGPCLALGTSWRLARFFFGGMPAGSAALVFLLSRYCGLVMLSGLLPHRWRLYGIARMLLIASQFYHVSPIFADGNVMFIQS